MYQLFGTDKLASSLIIRIISFLTQLVKLLVMNGILYLNWQGNRRTAISLVIVAGLWGATNPFIKRGSKGIEKVKSSSAVGQFFAELWFLATNWKYLLPFLVNQSGSIVYYITLASAELSLAVPITNSLTFIFTSISGKLLGEKSPSRTTLIGMGLVIVGVLLCVMDKV